MADGEKTASEIKGRLRRMHLMILRREHVKKSVSLRKGECNQCGECCKFVFECPMLQKKKGKYTCRIYKVRPDICRLFPLTHEDIRHLSHECDFFWHKCDIIRIMSAK